LGDIIIQDRIEMEIEGVRLIFDSDRSIYWPDKQTLIISDLHIGKSGHFRKNGIAISGAVHDDDLRRLKVLIAKYEAKELLILGDLSHSTHNKEWNNFAEWCIEVKDELKISLVPGNHDILGSVAYNHARIKILDTFHSIEPFRFSHEPKEVICLDDFRFAGHIHPGVRMQGAGRQGVTLPCFHISALQCVLPAFSGFTGRYKIKPKKGDKVLPILPKGIALITG
jgi:DNA ligase-associated metallophosphoesterase